MPPSDFVGSENRELGQETMGQLSSATVCWGLRKEWRNGDWIDEGQPENGFSPWYWEEWKERCQSIETGSKTKHSMEPVAGTALQQSRVWGSTCWVETCRGDPRRLKNCMVALEKLEGKQTHGQDKLILRHVTELNTDEKILSLNPLSFSTAPLNLSHKSNTDLN